MLDQSGNSWIAGRPISIPSWFMVDGVGVRVSGLRLSVDEAVLRI